MYRRLFILSLAFFCMTILTACARAEPSNSNAIEIQVAARVQATLAASNLAAGPTSVAAASGTTAAFTPARSTTAIFTPAPRATRVRCSVQAAQFLKEGQELFDEWSDTAEVASHTSKIALSATVTQLQDIKRRWHALDAPPRCAEFAKEYVEKYMAAIIDAYLKFMGSDDAASLYFTLADIDRSTALRMYESAGLPPPAPVPTADASSSRAAAAPLPTNTPPVSAKSTRIPASSNADPRTGAPIEILEILSTSIPSAPQSMSAALELGETTEKDIMAIVDKEFPVEAMNVTSGASYEQRYRYLVADYDDFQITYHFGAQPDSWNGKLFSIALSAQTAGSRVDEVATNAYKRLVAMYGQPSRVEKFTYRLSLDKQPDKSDLNLYVWELPHSLVTYRAPFQAEQQSNSIVVEFWDPAFYKAYNYYDLDAMETS